ncbi:MAG: isocitrate lyase/PEP mutase family protein [Chloroflexi bacterium]|nr:isocitrate lyase/PEP mutase family protein [Chloroflexota bacterium]
MKATTSFRQLLAQPGIITAPGAYDCLTAAIIERTGFPAVYMTGAGTSVARIGYPDLALATATEMMANAASIASTVSVPVIADADTGYGGTMNVRRTIREYERTGVAAVHIEDQQFPKRCGHLEDKRVVPIDEMVQKIHAAVDARTDDDFTIIVRTDALAVTGWDDTMRRCDAFTEAGADALFVEAIRSPEEAAEVVAHTSVPLLYNFVETGKSPLLNVAELETLGFKMVIFPGSAFMSVAHTVARVMSELKDKGTTEHLVGEMTPLTEAFELMGLSEMLERDSGYAVSSDASDYAQEENRRFRALERKALAIYHSQIEPNLTESDHGKWLIINTENAGYEILATEFEGLQRLQAYGHKAPVYFMPIGEPEPVLIRSIPPGGKS